MYPTYRRSSLTSRATEMRYAVATYWKYFSIRWAVPTPACQSTELSGGRLSDCQCAGSVASWFSSQHRARLLTFTPPVKPGPRLLWHPSLRRQAFRDRSFPASCFSSAKLPNRYCTGFIYEGGRLNPAHLRCLSASKTRVCLLAIGVEATALRM